MVPRGPQNGPNRGVITHMRTKTKERLKSSRTCARRVEVITHMRTNSKQKSNPQSRYLEYFHKFFPTSVRLGFHFDIELLDLLLLRLLLGSASTQPVKQINKTNLSNKSTRQTCQPKRTNPINKSQTSQCKTTNEIIQSTC